MGLFKKEDYAKHEVIEKKLVFKKTELEDRGESDKKYFVFTEPGKRKEIYIHAGTRLIQSGPHFNGNGVFTIGYDMYGTPYYIIKGDEVWFRYRQSRIMHEGNGRTTNHSVPISSLGKQADPKLAFKSKPIKTPAFAKINWRDMTEKQKKKMLAWTKKQDKKGLKDPMSVDHTYWVYVTSKKKKGKSYDRSLSDPGKWLVFVNPENVKKVWGKIRRATEKGLLGDASKCSTAKPNPNSKGIDQVICVYTYDSNDVKDVMRIRKQLTKLGIEGKIPYKTDQAAREGKYSVRGHKRISKYYC